MKPKLDDLRALRRHRNAKLYRSLSRTLRVYNRQLIEQLRARGFEDFSPAFPQVLSNLDTRGTRIGVLAARAGVSRQAAGQLINEIARCGYVTRRVAKDDARATTVHFTARGRKLLENVLELVEATEATFAKIVGASEFARLRRDLERISDEIDPGGGLGTEDE